MSGRHIVMATVGSQGDLFPFLAVGRELRARGQQRRQEQQRQEQQRQEQQQRQLVRRGEP